MLGYEEEGEWVDIWFSKLSQYRWSYQGKYDNEDGDDDDDDEKEEVEENNDSCCLMLSKLQKVIPGLVS